MKSFIQGVKNLWKWFPVIWKDRDWDSHFIYEVMRFKIGNQSKYIGEHDRHTRAKRDSEMMTLTTRLIQRCQDEYYDLEYMDFHEWKLNWLDVDGRPDLKEMDIEDVSDNFDEYFKKYPRQYKKVLSGELNRFRREVGHGNRKVYAMEIAHENQDRCRKLLFKIMERNIEGWWD